MELREVRSAGEWAFRLELHPRLTVVTGLGPRRRAQLAAILNASLTHAVAGVVLIAETDEGPRPVSAAELIEAGVPEAFEIRVRARDLPGAVVTASIRHGDDGEQDQPESEGVLAARRCLDDARQSEKMAREGLDRVLDASPPAPPDAKAAARQAEDARRRVATAIEAVAQSGGPAAIALREAAVDALQRERDELDAFLAAPWEPPDTRPVAEAAAALRAALEAEGQPSAVAEALAERWAELDRRWVALDAAAGSREAEMARSHVELARVELARAEQYAKPLYVSPADRAELDAAHELVIRLEARARGKVASRMVGRRLDAARAVERGILQRIGVTSYDAFLLRTSSILGDLDAADRVAQARRRLAEAEAAWELAQGHEPEPVRDLRRERARLLTEAAELLGRAVPAAEVEAALRSHRVAPDVHGLEAAMASALQTAGVSVRGELLEEADAWLDRWHATGVARDEAQARRGAIDAELAAAVGALDAARVTAPAGSAEAAHHLASARAELDAAEAATAAAEQARRDAAAHAERLVAARRELARAERDRDDAEGELERQLALAADRGSQGRIPMAVVDEVDGRRVDHAEAEVYLLARIAGLRDVGVVGGLPLVLDEPFLPLGDQATASMLGLLERVGSVVQVVYLTDDPAVVAWASRRQPQGAVVVRFAPE